MPVRTPRHLLYVVAFLCWQVVAQSLPVRGQHNTWQQVRLGVGTPGITAGFEAKLRDSSRFSYAGFISYLGFRQAQVLNFDEGSVLTVFPDIRKVQVGATAYFYPFRRQRWVSFAGGLGVDLAQTYDLRIATETGFNSDGLIISAEDFGTIETGIRWQRLMPYVGVRFASSPAKHRFTVGGELGAYYMGSPRLRVDYEGFLETTTLDQEIVKIERNMRGYSYFPHLSFTLGYRL